jgi:hypothetical protein
MISELAKIRNCRSGRISSYDVTGRNRDAWTIAPGEARVLADICGSGQITHIWMTQPNHYRECFLRITWDDAPAPSILCPLGDFFGLGHAIVNSYDSLLFSTSTRFPYQFNRGCALNCYIPMPFKKRALVELINESLENHLQYFYIDYELLADIPAEYGYFHSEFRRLNPFGGWGPEIATNKPGFLMANIVNKEKQAWDNNYIILETQGRGHYIGCNLSVTNFRGDWWGEGDDMIWVDGYKWPPDLHGTGSEDYLCQAWGMQDVRGQHYGSSIFEGKTTVMESSVPWNEGGYQTSYVYHIENPVHFQREIKVTIEHGHGNHLANEMSSVAYWYAAEPTQTAHLPPVAQRQPVLRDNQGHWIEEESRKCQGKPITLNAEMRRMKDMWKKETNK